MSASLASSRSLNCWFLVCRLHLLSLSSFQLTMSTILYTLALTIGLSMALVFTLSSVMKWVSSWVDSSDSHICTMICLGGRDYYNVCPKQRSVNCFLLLKYSPNFSFLPTILQSTDDLLTINPLMKASISSLFSLNSTDGWKHLSAEDALWMGCWITFSRACPAFTNSSLFPESFIYSVMLLSFLQFLNSVAEKALFLIRLFTTSFCFLNFIVVFSIPERSLNDAWKLLMLFSLVRVKMKGS